MREIRVQVYARLRELAGAEAVSVRVPEPALVGAVRAALAVALPGAAALLPHCVFALGAELANDAAAVPPGAEVACLPPVSGG
jgi:sulfur-carrier protein